MPITPKLEEARKATQFKPGVSGNPKGNYKGTKHLTTHIQEILEDEDFEANLLDSKLGLVEFKGKPIVAIIKAAQQKAVQGDLKAMELLMKYGWSAKQEIDLTSLGESVAQPLDQNLLTQFLMNIENNTKR